MSIKYVPDILRQHILEGIILVVREIERVQARARAGGGIRGAGVARGRVRPAASRRPRLRRSESNFSICFLLEILLRGFPFHKFAFNASYGKIISIPGTCCSPG